MPIVTTHPEPVAQPAFDTALCTQCGTCAATCPSQSIVMRDGRPAANPAAQLGCIACGQCMCVCPSGAVSVRGRGLSPDDLLPLPARSEQATAAQLAALMLARRSVRSFEPREVPPEIVKRLLDAAACAPMGIPPSEVRVLVIQGRDKVRQFSAEMDQCFRGAQGFFRSPLMALLKLIMKPADRAMLSSFIVPLTQTLVDGHAAGKDVLLYDAPLVLLFHTSPYADQSDSKIAATYAMLAAEAEGLGSCMIGSVCPFLQRNAKLMASLGLPRENRLGIVLVAGYPARSYLRTLRRRLAKIHYA